MTKLCSEVLSALNGRTLATAESCTGGMIGEMLTAIPGSSKVYKGGIISYCNELKNSLLGVPEDMLTQFGAVSAPVALAMAMGVRCVLNADVAVSVTGLAGPSGDEFGREVGTVFIGFNSSCQSFAKEYLFSGDRESVRRQAAKAALLLILEYV